ncbi:unnamed protein product [Notodromas monacha]|uniref:EF-hand domain-containing protein n=1 Tax=Notodromas monacha TaxID=399045 RepID=A0A7R9BFX6_9CRUS|nr:unnamed protein product [Notodromas monacha]CAG0914729.1 unnamed protein product [Notodromas monacha]
MTESKPIATESFDLSDESRDVRPPAHYRYKLPTEDEERLERLFRELDISNDGRIDVKDLTQGLQRKGIILRPSDAMDMVKQGDLNASGDMDFAEFIHYMVEHEKRLRLVFSTLDVNQDGRLDKGEIMASFKDLGISLTENECANLLGRIDKDGSLDISFEEWREFLYFHPSGDLKSILAYWKHPPELPSWVIGNYSRVFNLPVLPPHPRQVLDIGEAIDVPEDFSESELRSGLWWRHLVAGAIAGAVSRTSTAPLDRLKVFLQVHGLKQFGNLNGCLNHMLSEGGIGSLWRGNGINVLKIAPESALKFMAYEQMKRFIRGDVPREIMVRERFLAGSFAGAFSQSVIYPMEVLKTRLALRKTGEFKGILDAAKKIYDVEGFRGFYRGYVPNLVGIIPYAGIELAVYETLKQQFISKQNGEPSVFVALFCATTSSTCGQICAYPLALVRTKLQAQVVERSQRCSKAVQITVPSGPGGAGASTAAAATATAHPSSATEMIRSILRTEGWTGLYRGLLPNFMKVIPAVSISYAQKRKHFSSNSNARGDIFLLLGDENCISIS